jgi:uncharacterized membrane protein YsdA (DUF1294 family)
MKIAALAYVVVVAVMSLASFIAYGVDKRQAANGGRRVSESTLHLMAFLGGWPGAWIGQRQFRHKTQKLTFRILFWMVVVLHVASVGAVAFVLSFYLKGESESSDGRLRQRLPVSCKLVARRLGPWSAGGTT